MKKKIKAFSLIELLISLIVISLIIAAFTPVLSKKLKHREIALGSNGKIETKCWEKFNEKCIMCSETECLLCTNSFSCSLGYYSDAQDECKCKSCSGKFSYCSKCTKNYCEACITGYKPDSNGVCKEVICNPGEYKSGSECKPCVSPCATCTGASSCVTCVSTHEMIGGICREKCAPGWHREGVECKEDVKEKTLQTPTGQTDCGGATSNAFYYDGMCITTRNAGDSGGPSIDIDGITKLNAGRSNICSTIKEKNCCWMGVSGAKTGSSCTKDSIACTGSQYACTESGNYQSCSRTVCQLEAAKKICANYATDWAPKGKWKLPEPADAAKWANGGAAVLKTGLELCQHGTNTGIYNSCYYTTQCKKANEGSNIDHCTPCNIWTNSSSIVYRLQKNVFQSNSTSTNGAYSVRCITKEVLK